MTLTIPQITFQMKISSIRKLEKIWSSNITVQNIPWKIQVRKQNSGINQSLAVYLHCAKQDIQIDESYTAAATFQLVPFDINSKSIVHYNDPCVFDSSEIGCGTNSLISWADLIDAKTSYVRDNTIILQIKIEVVDPNDKKMSRLVFDTVDKSCENSCHATFRLQIKNIKNLIAVRSPLFIQHNLPWYLTVYKNHSNHLGIYLFSKGQTSCRRRMSVKLLSVIKRIEPIEETKTENLEPGNTLSMPKMISWNKLLKRENGFNSNNSIQIEVEIALENVNFQNEKNFTEKNMKSLQSYARMKCAICLEIIRTQEVSSLQCGHMFCSKCIKESLNEYQACPLCKASVNLMDLRRVYLPL